MLKFKPLSFEKPLEFVNKVRTIFYIMVGVPLSGFIFLYFYYREHDLHIYDQNLSPIWLFVLPVLCITAAIYGFVNYKKRLKIARKQERMRDRLNMVFQATMEKFVLLEALSFVVLIAYFFNQHILYAGLYMVMLILFAMNNPTIYTVINDLRLPKDTASAMRQNHRIL